MIKVLYGSQFDLIENYIHEFVKENNITNIIKLDYEEVELSSVIEECSYLDLFGDIKLIVLYSSNFLGSKDTLEDESFINYLNNPNPSSHLFLVMNEEALDERKKVVKLLKSKYEIIEFNSFKEGDALRLVRESFKKDGYEIEESAVKKIVEYLQTNYGFYYNEIQKLKMYKIEDKIITLDDVLNVTSRIPEDNVFKLLDAVILNNKKEIFDIYKDLKNTGSDEIGIIGLIASQFRFMYQVLILANDGKNKSEIARLLNAHPYKTEIALKKINLYKESKIQDILLKLSEMDIDIKTGEREKSEVLEEFFLGL